MAFPVKAGVAVAKGPKGGKAAAPVAVKVGKPFAAKAPPKKSPFGASKAPPFLAKKAGGVADTDMDGFRKGGKVKK